MRGLLSSAAIAAALSLAAAPIAFAAQTKAMTPQSKTMAANWRTTTGTVSAFDASAHMLKLKDGTSYMLPASFKDPGIKVGGKVRVSWNMENGKHEAGKVTPLR